MTSSHYINQCSLQVEFQNCHKLVIVNNKSGKGKSTNTYNRYIKDFKNVHLHTIDKDNSESLKNDLLLETSYDIILVLGGDGTINSVLNILIDNGIKKPISHIPCGTGNGLCKSLLYLKNIEYSIENAVAELQNFNTKKINLFNINLKKDNKNIHGFLSMTWGLFSNIDIKTEWLRRMGSIRNTLGALWELLVKTSSFGEFLYLNENNQWISITDKFYYFTASNVSHICHDVFINKDIKMDDGYMHIGFIRGRTSRLNLLKLLLSFDKGTCEKYLQVVKTKHFILRPKDGILVVDGEQIKCQHIEINVLKDKLTIF